MTRAGFSMAMLFFFSLMIAPSAMGLGNDASLSSDNRRVRKGIRTFQQIRQAATIRQKWDYSCGSAALATILTHHYGDKTSEAVIITSILHVTDPVKIKSRGGFSLLDLKKFVRSRGYEGKGFAELTLDELIGLDAPAIVPIRMRGYDHFVVFRGILGDRVVLSDPSFGTVTMRSEQFLQIWNGGIGFIVIRPGSEKPQNGLKPRMEEVLAPDAPSIARLAAVGAVPLTRPGL
jgi:predicted double-glycine peptidase